MRIKDITPNERPRERMLRGEELSSAELLAIILVKGTRRENAIDISHRLISKYGVEGLSKCSVKELTQIDGIGVAKALQIKAMFELFGRQKKDIVGRQIGCAEDVYDYCSKRLSAKDKEHFMVILLDSKNRVIKEEIVSIGTLNSSLVHPREVFKSAIKESANSMILVHNHPSGDTTLSSEDIEVTQRLKDAGEILGIKVLDHLVVGGK